MKKKLLSLVVVCAMIFMVVGCSSNSDSPYLGQWNATEISMAGIDVSSQMSMTFDFKADGKVTMSFDGESQDIDWSETENGVDVKDSTTTVSFVKEGETLKGEYSGMTLVLQKQA